MATDGREKGNGGDDKTVIAAVKQHHQDSLNTIYRSLTRTNKRLVELKWLIRESQYKQHGSLTLSLGMCGNRCNGCPHAKWHKWIGKTGYVSRQWKGNQTKRQRKDVFFATETKYPLKVIAQSRAVKDDDAKTYVKEAVDLLKKRTQLIKHLRYAVIASNKLA